MRLLCAQVFTFAAAAIFVKFFKLHDTITQGISEKASRSCLFCHSVNIIKAPTCQGSDNLVHCCNKDIGTLYAFLMLGIK